MTYRVGNHWGVTIVREGERTPEGHIIGADVTHTNGAREALAHVRRQLDAWAKLTDAERVPVPAAGVFLGMLRVAAAELGVNEEAPARPLSATVAAERPPAGGSGCPEGVEADSGGCDCGHDGLDEIWHFHPCPIAQRRAARSIWNLPEPERKADRRDETCNRCGATGKPKAILTGVAGGPFLLCYEPGTRDCFTTGTDLAILRRDDQHGEECR